MPHFNGFFQLQVASDHLEDNPRLFSQSLRDIDRYCDAFVSELERLPGQNQKVKDQEALLSQLRDLEKELSKQ